MAALKTAAQIDASLAPVLRRMEEAGVKVDLNYLERLADDLKDQLADWEDQIYQSVGHQFAINSPKQLSSVIFDELKLKEVEGVRLRKKTTGFSTAHGQLEKLRGTHPVIDLILRYREIGKLVSTYVLPLPKLIGPDGRLHTHYAPDAASGRLSSRQPNLQNIPIRTELGKKIRQAFVAEQGYQLLSADYSQIELRVIAHLADDPTMLEVFRSGGDIHQRTSEALKIDRRAAKAVNFGIIYGLTAYGLAESLAVPQEEAQAFIDRYMGTYPRVAAYIKELIETAHAKGYATTLLGKKRLLPELKSSNDYIRRAAERVAINHPVQGTAAEIMKLAMIALDHHLHLGGETPEVSDLVISDCRMILQVHDELVFEVKAGKIDHWAPIIKKAMEGAVKLSVPLVVDFKVGLNWAEMKLLEAS